MEKTLMLALGLLLQISINGMETQKHDSNNNKKKKKIRFLSVYSILHQRTLNMIF